MNIKKLLGLSIVAIGVVTIVGMLFGISMDEVENNSQNVLETPKNSIYIPSDITKANPNFVVENTETLWKTTNIEDVADDVIFTFQGTVLSIDEPVDWATGPISAITNEQQTMGFIPITMFVDEVHKGNLTENTFTFYVTSHKYNGLYNFSPDAPNFEIGEKVLIHLAHSDLGPFPNGHYYVKLSQFGKYQLNIPNSISTSSIGNPSTLAFNIHHPNGVLLSSIISESVP